MLHVKQSRVQQIVHWDSFFFHGLAFSRWHDERKHQGKWRVGSAQGVEVFDWFGYREAFGVMDDFGNLVKVA